ncbi:hypothetical protein EDWATA_01684 [Edwardsiella tarda ATCC 23685]|uniref:Uncharacterized protein n=1 Tax=Edwardsiella tarda ATCC 23685 TaxID=500638 RepID=D4F4L1_EDWTA|nr:hypothetical protein EDWATA_01684 [Edwardsiella tarda ATCC 23685]
MILTINPVFFLVTNNHYQNNHAEWSQPAVFVTLITKQIPKNE